MCDLLSSPSHLCSLLGTSLLEYSCDREQMVTSGTEMKFITAGESVIEVMDLLSITPSLSTRLIMLQEEMSYYQVPT